MIEHISYEYRPGLYLSYQLSSGPNSKGYYLFVFVGIQVWWFWSPCQRIRDCSCQETSQSGAQVRRILRHKNTFWFTAEMRRLTEDACDLITMWLNAHVTNNLFPIPLSYSLTTTGQRYDINIAFARKYFLYGIDAFYVYFTDMEARNI